MQFPKYILSILLFQLFFVLHASAAKLTVSDGRVIRQGDRHFIEFTVFWKLSWHNDTNWDAAWIFAKDNTSGYQHLKVVPGSGRLIRNYNADQPAPGFSVSNDSLGVFLYRDEVREARGPNHWTVRLELAPSSEGEDAEALPESVAVYGIEMVYVPEGPFEAGDPAGIDGPSNAFFSLNADSTGTYRVTSSEAIPVCGEKGDLCYGERGGDQQGPIPAGFPNGYDAFYLMKYKVTQGQYADFLNTLTTTQANNRAIQGGKEYYDVRGSIVLEDGVYRAQQPDWACGFLGWRDGAAFADWAALRPYTELEYEKAARGPAAAVPNEYAWGATTIIHGDTLFEQPGIVAKYEDGDEYLRGNANYRPRDVDFGNPEAMQFTGGEGLMGPVRVDIFEARAHTMQEANLREASGAGYYGALGLTGGLFERLVSVGSELGRRFRGSHGDGQVSYSGLARNMTEDWPNRQAEGLALRARNYAFDTRSLQMANRGFGSYAAHYRNSGLGFRAARTAD